SSRRRHTRFSRDWSSDVCSSDLAVLARFTFDVAAFFLTTGFLAVLFFTVVLAAAFLAVAFLAVVFFTTAFFTAAFPAVAFFAARSEERRVGKACMMRCAQDSNTI